MTLLNQIKSEIQVLQKSNALGDDGFKTQLAELLLNAHGSFTRGYHLEFTIDCEKTAIDLCDNLAQHDIFAHYNSPPWRGGAKRRGGCKT